MARKILFEETTTRGEKWIEQDGQCLVFHTSTQRKNEVQVWEIKKVKEALARMQEPQDV